jgi:hypothetical protein
MLAVRIISCAFIAACLLQSVARSSDSIAPRYATAKITVEQWRHLLAEVKALPDVKCINYVLNQYACDSAAQRTIWIFTSVGHPAHPAVSRGILFANRAPAGAILGIDRSGHYSGNRAAFEKWMQEFAFLDQRQIAEWGK